MTAKRGIIPAKDQVTNQCKIKNSYTKALPSARRMNKKKTEEE